VRFLAHKLLSKRQTSAGGPTQFVIFFSDGWRGRTFLTIFFFGGGPFAEKITRRAGMLLTPARQATRRPGVWFRVPDAPLKRIKIRAFVCGGA
jgi:hypothetical protein